MTKNLLPAFLVFLNILHINNVNAQTGALDATFGNGGIILNTLDSWCQYTDIAFQRDGKILCGGTEYSDDRERPLLIRYKDDGQPDNSFGLNGTALFRSFNPTSMLVNDIATQTDGKIFAAGVEYSLYYELQDFFLVKFNSDGTPDSSFNQNGLVRTTFGLQPFGELGEILVQPDGKIIITGYSYDEFYVSSFIAVRYNADGSPDNSFGNNGVVLIRPGSSGDNRTTTAALQADGKILFAGAIDFDADPEHGDFAFVRLNPDGTLDNSFGVNGVAIVDNSGLTDLPIKVIIQPDGKIVSCGISCMGTDGNTYRSVLLRLNRDGSMDAGFGNNGIVFDLMSNVASYLYDVAVQADGKLVCSGSVYKDGMVYEGGKRSVLLARYNADGTPDNSLGGNGVLITQIEANSNADGFSLGLFNSRIYIAGGSYSENSFESGFVAAFNQKNYVLALEQLDFSAARKNNITALSWQTTNQQNVIRYMIQRSGDGLHFENIGSVSAITGNNTASYKFDDAFASRKEIFYRLQLVKNGGGFSYSKIVRIAGSVNAYTIKVYPNPASDILQVMINGINENAVVKVIDVNGRTVKEVKKVLTGNNTISVDIQKLPAGVYTLALYSIDGLKQQQFIKL